MASCQAGKPIAGGPQGWLLSNGYQGLIGLLHKAMTFSVHGVQDRGACRGEKGKWDWQPSGGAVPDNVP